MSDKHISSQFDTELNSISTHVLEMGGLVEAQLIEPRDAGVGLILIAHQHGVGVLYIHAPVWPNQQLQDVGDAVEVQTQDVEQAGQIASRLGARIGVR